MGWVLIRVHLKLPSYRRKGLRWTSRRVMHGLDPVIQALRERDEPDSGRLDARVKPVHDGLGRSAPHTGARPMKKQDFDGRRNLAALFPGRDDV